MAVENKAELVGFPSRVLCGSGDKRDWGYPSHDEGEFVSRETCERCQVGACLCSRLIEVNGESVRVFIETQFEEVKPKSS